MKQQPCATTALTLEARVQLPEAHLSSLWRVQTGAMRLNLHEPHDQNLIRMVLPGDLLGMERRVGITDHLVMHTLIPTTLIPVLPQDDAHLTRLLMEAVSHGYQRSRDMAALRTGTTDARVRRLLLAIADPTSDPINATQTCVLPCLSDMAALVNAAPETVCRSLTKLRRLNVLQDCSPQPSRHKQLGDRLHQLQGFAISPGAGLKSAMRTCV